MAHSVPPDSGGRLFADRVSPVGHGVLGVSRNYFLVEPRASGERMWVRIGILTHTRSPRLAAKRTTSWMTPYFLRMKMSSLLLMASRQSLSASSKVLFGLVERSCAIAASRMV